MRWGDAGRADHGAFIRPFTHSTCCCRPANVACAVPVTNGTSPPPTQSPPSPTAGSPSPAAALSPPPAPNAQSPPPTPSPKLAASPPPPSPAARPPSSPSPPAAHPPPKRSPPPPPARSPSPPLPVQRPPPPPRASPRPSPPPPSAAVAFCATQTTTGYFADVVNGCTGYYRCEVTGSWYLACSKGLLFNQVSTCRCQQEASRACFASFPSHPPPHLELTTRIPPLLSCRPPPHATGPPTCSAPPHLPQRRLAGA